jgi:hypothetical protein
MSILNPDAAPEPGRRETVHCVVDLRTADEMIAGWEFAVIYELRQMRGELPYASQVFLELSWEAGSDQDLAG